jgi:hypothetical protein
MIQAAVVIHETGHSFAGLLDEYLTSMQGSIIDRLESSYALRTVASLNTENCTSNPARDYRYPPYYGHMYGAYGNTGCNYLFDILPAAMKPTLPPSYFRPSSISMMNSVPPSPITLDGVQLTIGTGNGWTPKFNVISCGYLIAAIKGQQTSTANAGSHWQECLDMAKAGTVIADGIPPVASPPAVGGVSISTVGTPGASSFDVSGSGFTSTGNSVILVQTSQPPTVASAGGMLASFFSKVFSGFSGYVQSAFTLNSLNAVVPKVASTATFEIDDIPSSDGSTLTFVVPTSTPSGNYTVGISALNSTTTVTSYIIAVNNSGTGTPAPTLTLSASPTSVSSGASSAITWSSTNATACTINMNGSAWQTGTSGNISSGALTADTTFSGSCTGAGGNSTVQTIVVSVGSTIPTTVSSLIGIMPTYTCPPTLTQGQGIFSVIGPPPNSCIISTSANTAIAYAPNTTCPSGFTLTSANPTVCYSPSATPPAGSTMITACPVNYTLLGTVCNINPPKLRIFTASPTSVSSGASSNIIWSSTNATACNITMDGTAWQTGTSGTISSGALTADTIFSGSCDGPGGASAVRIVTVTVTGGVTPPSGASTVTPTYSCSTGTLSGSTCSVPAVTTTATTYTCPAGSGRTTTGCGKPVFVITSGQSMWCPAGSYFVSISVNWCADANGYPASTPVTPIYSCPSGYSVSGTSCITPATTVNATFICPSGYIAKLSTCYSTTIATAPVVTVGVTASSTIPLNWSLAYDPGVTYYSIFSDSNIFIASTTAKSYTVKNLTPSTQYCFIAYATKKPNYVGDTSTQVCGTTKAPTVAPTTPTLTLSASPSSVTSGGSSAVTWTSTGATSCSIKKNNVNWKTGTSGTSVSTGVLTTTTTITGTCTGTGGTSPTQTATVTIGTVVISPGTIPATATYSCPSLYTINTTTHLCTRRGYTSGAATITYSCPATYTLNTVAKTCTPPVAVQSNIAPAPVAAPVQSAVIQSNIVTPAAIPVVTAIPAAVITPVVVPAPPTQTTSTIPATASYSCSTGTLSGSTCVTMLASRGVPPETTISCPTGYLVNSTKTTCTPRVESLTRTKTVVLPVSTKTCPFGTTLDTGDSLCHTPPTTQTTPSTPTYTCPVGYTLDSVAKTCSKVTSMDIESSLHTMTATVQNALGDLFDLFKI